MSGFGFFGLWLTLSTWLVTLNLGVPGFEFLPNIFLLVYLFYTIWTLIPYSVSSSTNAWFIFSLLSLLDILLYDVRSVISLSRIVEWNYVSFLRRVFIGTPLTAALNGSGFVFYLNMWESGKNSAVSRLYNLRSSATIAYLLLRPLLNTNCDSFESLPVKYWLVSKSCECITGTFFSDDLLSGITGKWLKPF